MCFRKGEGQMHWNIRIFFGFFLALVGLLPAGDGNILVLVACINLSVLINVIRIKINIKERN